LEAKRRLVQESLERIGGFKSVSVLPARGMEKAPEGPWRYRNKVQQPVVWSASRRKIVTGFYAPYSHTLIPISDCLVQPKNSVALFNAARDCLEQFHAQAYGEDSGRGWIRHLLLRSSHATGRALLVFVTRTDEFPLAADYIETLTRSFPFLSGIHQNVNLSRTNVILGRQWRTLWGEEYIEERLGSLRFRLTAGSFFQVNTIQAEVLYAIVRNSCLPLPFGERVGVRAPSSGLRPPSSQKGEGIIGDTLLDLYCGVGGIALTLADRFKHVIGVEEFAAAAQDAEVNARLNGIRNAKFTAMPAEQFLRLREARNRDLTIVLDPPRAGCSPVALKAVIAAQPRRLVYVSCDPATLARDLKILAAKGFLIELVQPVDLFPQTPHIETVVTMTRSAP
jgi:23S rRNA (uracil1939-C5)-methyltransferase